MRNSNHTSEHCVVSQLDRLVGYGTHYNAWIIVIMWRTFKITSEPRNETLVTYMKCKKAAMISDDCARWKVLACINESDFMDATKQRSSMTGWITFPVTAVWLCNLWFRCWRSRWQHVICNWRSCIPCAACNWIACILYAGLWRISVANTPRHYEPQFSMTASKRCERWITAHLLYRINWKDMGTLIEKKNAWDKEVQFTEWRHVKWKWYKYKIVLNTRFTNISSLAPISYFVIYSVILFLGINITTSLKLHNINSF
jgi:hypothetical protein